MNVSNFFLLRSEKELNICCLHFACILLSLSHCNIRFYPLIVAMQEILSKNQSWRILTELEVKEMGKCLICAQGLVLPS